MLLVVIKIKNDGTKFDFPTATAREKKHQCAKLILVTAILGVVSCKMIRGIGKRKTPTIFGRRNVKV